MKHVAYISNLILVSLILVSCIKEDYSGCPAPGTITVEVRDKNYDNIEEIQGLLRLDERLPFSSYLTTLAIWRHAEGAATSESFETVLGEGETAYTVDQSCLLPGRQELVVVGNEAIKAQKYNMTALTRELFPQGREYADIYIGSEDITSPLYEDHVIWMYRVKGKLLVLPVDIPSDIVGVEVSVGDVYRTVGKDLAYSGSGEVAKSFDIAQSDNGLVLSIIVAPSISPANESPVTIRFTKQDRSIVTLSNIYTRISRNRISVIRPAYHQDSGEWTLETLVDGRWIRIDNLHIDRNIL